MKIRMWFITNSSSTNFLIISKKELTEDYLFKKLGFIKGGALEEQGRQLCNSIMNAIEGGLRYYSYEMPDYESIKKVFGNKVNLMVCIKALEEFVLKMNEQKKELDRLMNKYSPNRATRRSKK